jgi:hypothetical protein
VPLTLTGSSVEGSAQDISVDRELDERSGLENWNWEFRCFKIIVEEDLEVSL